jgi:hypothetical protein
VNSNQINIIINESNANTFWFHIFSKYSNNLFLKSNEDIEETPYSENNILFQSIKKNFDLEYKEYKINVIFEYIDESNLKESNNTFYFLCDYLYDFRERYESCNKFSKIHYSIEEIPFTNEKVDLVNNFLNLSEFSLITSTNLKSNSKNLLYDYRISLVYFYYLLGMYHLSLEPIDVSKETLLGSYYRKGYRIDRDNFFEKIQNLIDIKNYSIDYKNDNTILYDLKYMDGWYGNHISSYTDYLKSVCNIVVESEESESTNLYYHCTEKTLKAILFSKLNIFFIYYANHNLVRQLVDDGFWFLNFEFLDKGNITESNIDESIEKSLNYLSELNNKFKDYNLIHSYLMDKFGEKLKNNYKIFDKIKNSNYLTDKILDFLIYKINNNKRIL